MKTQHDGDCTIYAALSNENMPELGICTCGYGLEQLRQGNYNELYSQELKAELTKQKGLIQTLNQEKK